MTRNEIWDVIVELENTLYRLDFKDFDENDWHVRDISDYVYKYGNYRRDERDE